MHLYFHSLVDKQFVSITNMYLCNTKVAQASAYSILSLKMRPIELCEEKKMQQRNVAAQIPM